MEVANSVEIAKEEGGNFGSRMAIMACSANGNSKKASLNKEQEHFFLRV